MAITPERLAQLMDEHAAALELYARQWCDTPADVVQEAFIELARQIEPPRHPAAWLYRAAKHGALSTRRSSRRRRRREAVAAADNWFEDALDRAVDGTTATAALKTLSEEQREAVIAHLWGGLTFDEIGEATDTSSSTAHRRYSAGIEALRKRLGVTWVDQNESVKTN